MKSRWIPGLLLLAGMSLSSASAAPQERFWVGGAKLGENWIYVKLKLSEQAGRSSADLHAPQVHLVHRAIDGVAFSDGRIRLAVDEGGKRIELDGGVQGDSIVGRLTASGISGDLRLEPYLPAAPERLDAASGDYRLRDGRLISVVREADGLRVLDLASGDSTLTWPGLESGSFFQVLPLDDGFVRGTKHFRAGFHPETSTASFSFSDGTTVDGSKVVLYREETVRTETPAGSLVGTLKIPAGSSKAPAIVIVSGSGPNDRRSNDHIQRLFALNGIAVLSYDKRGLGESKLSGTAPDWDHASFSELADDVVAWVKALKARPDIDPRRIGLWGHSQGGWIAPIAASRCPDVRFLEIVSAPTVNPLSQTTYYTEHQMRADGFRESDIAQALGYMHRLSAIAAAGGHGFAEFKPNRDAASAGAWADYVATPETVEELLGWPSFDYEPVPTLLKLRIPVLAVYAERDTLIPGVQSALTMQNILRTAGPSSSEVVRFPEGDHEMFQVVRGSTREWTSRRGYCAGYFPKMLDWVRGQIGA